MAACSLGGAPFRGVALSRPTVDGLDYTVSGVVDVTSVIGDILTALVPGLTHVWDNGNVVEVHLAFGSRESPPFPISAMAPMAR